MKRPQPKNGNGHREKDLTHLHVNIPAELHRRLKRKALDEDKTVRTLVIELIEQRTRARAR